MINGVLLINKKAGCTSHSVVNTLRKLIGQKQVGHAGTLDPMAEGLLVILLGYGTKLSNYLLMNDKKYKFTFRLGVVTDTLDKTGKIISQKPVTVDVDRIKQSVLNSQGKISLSVPLFSAVKVKGKKMYEYERENKDIKPPKRDMFFYDLVIKNIKKDTVEVELSCSKGSYIRSWVFFVGETLGVGACLEHLVRLSSSPFGIKSALTIQEIEEKLGSDKTRPMDIFLEKISPAFIPFSKAIPHIQSVVVSSNDERLLRQGCISRNLKMSLEDKQKDVNKNQKAQTIKVMSVSMDRLLALLELRPFHSPQFLRVFPSDVY